MNSVAWYSITHQSIREQQRVEALLLIDTHSHFDDPRLDESRESDYIKAFEQGVVQQVIPAVAMRSWARTRDICANYTGLYAAYGLHPYFLDEHHNEHLDLLKSYLNDNNAVAVGECGLDFFNKTLDKEAQTHYFREQLSIASECLLPVIVHANRASEDVIQHLRASGVQRGVVHSFNGSFEQAKQLIGMGFLMSFGGVITYDRALKLRRLVQDLPLDSIMIETDAPDQAPALHKGELNKPAYLLDIFASVCELRSETPEKLAEQLNANACQLFQLPPIKQPAH